jgi:beta-phosphoglucomutase-like phosphatase (HAD superfamily)
LLFLHAATSVGAEPEQCSVVEDSELGIAAVHAAEMTVCGYAAMTPAGRLAGATVVFTAMAAA